MDQLNHMSLSPNQRKALGEARRRLVHEFAVEQVVLYDSVARGEADEESDLDLLIVTRRPFSRIERHQITDVVFEINLPYGTNLSTLVIDYDTWETGLVSVLPIREEILKDGVPL